MKIGEYKQAMSHMLKKDNSLENFTFDPEAKLEDNDLIKYAMGGRVGMAAGGDPGKVSRIKKLILSGDYNKKQIIDILQKEGYGKTRTGKDSIVNKIANQLNVELPVGMTEKGFAAQEAKGKYLSFYNNTKLESDLKKGKTIPEIAKDLYENNTKYYNNIGVTEDNLPVLNSALNSKILKNKDFINLHNDNLAENVKQQKQVLKDVDSFIKNNKQKYLDLYNSNKIGAPDKFKEDIIDFIEDKHPDFIKTVEEYNPKNPLAKGSKVLDLPDVYERDVIRAGDYGKDVFLKKKIRESLGIPERPTKGEGISLDRMARLYNQNTLNLLQQAKENGIIPEIDPITGNPINNEAAYYRYSKRMLADPINKLFDGQFRFGVEHVGGISRAAKINDYESLDKAVALDTYVNRFIKSSSYDNRISNLVELAKQAPKEKAKEYISNINKQVEAAEEKYGIPLTKYEIKNNEIKAIHPDISINDPITDKAKIAIKGFIANDGIEHPNFKKLDPDLQKSIINYSKGKEKEADSLLEKVIKQKEIGFNLPEKQEQAISQYMRRFSSNPMFDPQLYAETIGPENIELLKNGMGKIFNSVKENPYVIASAPLKAIGYLAEKTFYPLTAAETAYKSIFEGENPLRALTESVIPGAETILHHKDVINNLSPEGKKLYQKSIEDEARNQYSSVEGIPQQIEERSLEEILKTQSELSKHMEEAEQKTQEQKEQKIKDIQEKLQNIPDSMDYNTAIGAAKGGLIND